MRRAIGAAMARSKREIPHYYLSTTIDITAMQQWIEAQNAQRPPPQRLLLAVPLLKAIALALRGSPELNGYYVAGNFQPSAAIHLGIAIAIRGGGLMAPAIHDVDKLALDELMTKLRDLGMRARSGGLRSSELSDPTVTVTNIGERGVEAVFGIIYPPQVALIGLGKPVERPAVVESKVVPRRTIVASLSADHRVSDGHRGALFLAEMDRLLQAPEKL
jgi:pyruvate dehydrogenase E2 component (dihydrolipoamide acetyltransferase)